MKILRSLKNNIYTSLLESYKDSEPHFFTYGVAVLIGVLGYYYFNQNVFIENSYENLPLRIVISILALPLIFHKYWPLKLIDYKKWYWYFVLICTSSFFFSFMMLMNPSSHVWHLNGFFALIVLVLFVDWILFIVLLFIGVVLGTLFYSFERNNLGPLFPNEVSNILYGYIGPIVFIMLFSGKRNRIQQAKHQTMKMLAGSIAHELRTPLSAIRSIGNNIMIIINKHKESQKPLSQKHIQHLEKYSNNLNLLVSKSNHVIDITLGNLREDITSFPFETLSMQQCVANCINNFPFASEQKQIVELNIKEDFSFDGNNEFMQQVLFNLIQNSLYFIQQAGKGKIFVSVEGGNIVNSLIFTDTGKGMSSKIVSQLFQPFYVSLCGMGKHPRL